MKLSKVAGLLAMVMVATALQAQSRSINFTEVMKGLNGAEIMQPGATQNDKPTPLTLGDIVVNALTTPLQADQTLSGEDKFKMFLLAQRVFGKKAVTLAPDELKIIKDRIGKVYGASIIVGVAWEALDPTLVPKVTP